MTTNKHTGLVKTNSLCPACYSVPLILIQTYPRESCDWLSRAMVKLVVIRLYRFRNPNMPLCPQWTATLGREEESDSSNCWGQVSIFSGMVIMMSTMLTWIPMLDRTRHLQN